MTLQPQNTGGNGRIDARLFPPCRFVATAVNFSMMAPTQGDRFRRPDARAVGCEEQLCRAMVVNGSAGQDARHQRVDFRTLLQRRKLGVRNSKYRSK
jgi:hypothetical protein